MTERPESPDLRARLQPLARVRHTESWPAVAAWLDTRAASGGAVAARTPARTPATGVRTRRTLAVGAGLLLAACVVPLPHEETLGQVLRVHVAGPVAEARDRLAGLGWMHRGTVFTADASGGASPTLLFVAPRATAAEAARWARELEGQTGAGTVTAEPLRDVVRRPTYAVAARAVLGVWGATWAADDAELDARVRARLRALTPGSVAVKADGHGGGSLLVVPRPADAAAPALGVYVPGTRDVVLWVARRRPDGSGEDTVRVALDGAEYAAARGAVRQALVERTLRARGVTNVRVEFVNGGVWVRTEPRRP